MGDDDFNLDDDLGLGDSDSDFGGGGGGGGGADSDFAGSVDSEMDDAGGGSGGGETELDSFFEDLSSIDDVESPEPEAKPAPRAAAPAAVAAAPVAAAAVGSAPKGKGKLKMILIVVLLLVGLAVAAQWYMSNSQPEELALETPPAETPALEQTAVPAEEPVRVEEAKPLPPPPPRAPVKPMPPPPPPEPVAEEPAIPSLRYLVQVGSCNFEKCQRDYADHLRRLGQPVYYRTTGEKYDFIELVTRDVFALRDAQNWIKIINDANQRAGVANLVPQSNGFRVSLGNFTSLDKAKDLKIYLENLFPKEGLKLNLEHVRKDYDTIKVFAGPFNSKAEAARSLQKFREHRSFTGAFIVRY